MARIAGHSQITVIVDLLEKGGCAWGNGARPAYCFCKGSRTRAVEAGHDERPVEWMAQVSAGQHRRLPFLAFWCWFTVAPANASRNSTPMLASAA